MPDLTSLPVSPCVGACKIDVETQACSGCARTRQEIAEFGMRYREAMQRMREGKPGISGVKL